MFNKDNWILGMLIGFLLPVIVYFLLILVLMPYGQVEGVIYTPRPKIPFLVAVVSNLFPFRFYMVSKKKDRTGRGILLVTFVMILIYFMIF